jgi:hypothetical protein
MAAILLLAISLVALWGQVNPPAPSYHARLFYFTKNAVTGDQATGACANGYHMASVYEVYVAIGNLKYNAQLGVQARAAYDDGLQPQAASWIHNGEPIGKTNCEGWTSKQGYVGQGSLGQGSYYNTGAVASLAYFLGWIPEPNTAPHSESSGNRPYFQWLDIDADAPHVPPTGGPAIASMPRNLCSVPHPVWCIQD